MPMERDRNARPKAEKTPWADKSENLGRNKNFRPSEAPSKVHARIQRITMMTKSNGIIIFVYRSMPFFIPANTYKAR